MSVLKNLSPNGYHFGALPATVPSDPARHEPSYWADTTPIAPPQPPLIGERAALRGALEHFPTHPIRYVQGWGKAVRDRRANMHEGSRVVTCTREGHRHVFATSDGRLRAKRVMIATKGYTPDGLHHAVRGRLMNVLSNIMVTQPLTPAQLEGTNWRTRQMLIDTRIPSTLAGSRTTALCSAPAAASSTARRAMHACSAGCSSN